MSPLSWLGYGASFMLVISFIFLMRFAVRYLEPKLSARGMTKSLKIMETLPLDPKRRLIIFACSARRGLLLTGNNGDQFIGWLEDDQTDSALRISGQEYAVPPDSNHPAERRA